jgi:hypothetical protein
MYDQLSFFASVRPKRQYWSKKGKKRVYYGYYVTIPQEIRKRLGVAGGSEVYVTLKVMER